MNFVKCLVSLLFAAAMIFGLMARSDARGDTRVALVIGNSSYEQVAPLENPGRDARAIAEALKGLGFETTLVLDQDSSSLKQALRRLNAKAKSADIAAVYYAGHGMEAGGENYLIPVDATLKNDDDVDYELVPLDLVLKAVSGAKQLRLVMLDACRNNPFSAQMAKSDGTRSVGRGFVRVEPNNNTLVAYAAKDGTTADDGDGDHSPFAAALLKWLPDPGVEITFLFRNVRDDVLAATAGRQEPFVYGSMGGKPVYLVSAAPPPPAPEPAPIAQVDPKALDLSYWNSIQGSENAGLYDDYLKRFPDGTFSEVAKAKLQQLKAKQEAQIASLAAPPPPASPEIEVLDGTYVAVRATAIRSAPNDTAKTRKKLRIDDTVKVTGRVKDGEWLRVGEGDAAGYIPLGDLAATEEGEVAAWSALKKAPTLATAKEFQAQFPDSPFKDRVAAIVRELTPPPIEVESLDTTYVVKQTANIRTEPNATAKLLGKLAPDAGVAVTGKVKDKDWLRVQQGADTGYVSASQLAPIDASEMADWQALQTSPTFEAAQTYLQKHSTGYFKDRVSALANKLAPPPPAPAAPEIETLSGTYIATQAANLRAEPNASAKALGKLVADDTVAVTGKVKDSDWFQVDREGQVAFVSAKLLQKIDENELKAWRQLNVAPKLEATDAFITQYPNGYFAPKAQVLKASLQPEQQPKPTTEPAVAAVVPEEPSIPKVEAPAPAPSNVKVGRVYLLWTILKTDDPKAAIGAKQYEFKDRIEVISSSGDGTFIGKSQQLPVVGDLRITAKGGALKIEFYTSAGRGEFRLQKLDSGELDTFGGSGSVFFSMNESGAVRYEGKARMTPMSKSEGLPESTPQVETLVPAPGQVAAITPPAAPAIPPSSEIQVDDAYELHAVLRCRCVSNAAAPKTQTFDGTIKVMSAEGGGSFDGEASDIGAGGTASSISIRQSGDLLTIKVATRDGPVVFSLNRVAPGRYSGRGKAAFKSVSGGDPYLGDATLTLAQ